MISDSRLDRVYFAIGLVPIEGKHCGIVFRSTEAELKYLHFAWQSDLRCERLRPSDLILVETDLSNTNKRILAILAEDIHSQNASREIPYSFDSLGVEFDA